MSIMDSFGGGYKVPLYTFQYYHLIKMCDHFYSGQVLVLPCSFHRSEIIQIMNHRAVKIMLLGWYEDFWS